MAPMSPSTRVETRRAVKEKPRGRQNRTPHGICMIRLVAVQPEIRSPPVSMMLRTENPYAQSSNRGKSPTGFTTKAAIDQTVVSSTKAIASDFSKKQHCRAKPGTLILDTLTISLVEFLEVRKHQRHVLAVTRVNDSGSKLQFDSSVYAGATGPLLCCLKSNCYGDSPIRIRFVETFHCRRTPMLLRSVPNVYQ